MTTTSSWNHPKKKNRHARKPFDSFLLGFAISLLLTVVCNIAVFKTHWDTEQPMLYAMKKLAEKGFLSRYDYRSYSLSGHADRLFGYAEGKNLHWCLCGTLPGPDCRLDLYVTIR